MNAYRLVLEGPGLLEELTINALTIAEAAGIAEEYRDLAQALTVDTGPAGTHLKLRLERLPHTSVGARALPTQTPPTHIPATRSSRQRHHLEAESLTRAKP